MTKVARKPKANFIGVVNSIAPCQAVAIQLKNLMPVGTAMAAVSAMNMVST